MATWWIHLFCYDVITTELVWLSILSSKTAISEMDTFKEYNFKFSFLYFSGIGTASTDFFHINYFPRMHFV